MDKQLKKIYLYMGIFVAIIFIGATYAFFTAGMSSENSTTVRADAGTMKITYSGGANINLAGIYPKDDVWATKTITVTGNNTTDAEMYYKLTLVVDSNTFKTDDQLQYELVSTNTSTNGEIIPNISKKDIAGTSIELGSGHFVKANNAKHTYLLKIYYPRKATSQNANQGASFSAHVEITSAKASNNMAVAAPKGWNESEDGTILAALRDNNTLKTPLTIPGKEVNAHVLNDVESKTSSVSSTEQGYYVTYGTGWKVNKTDFDLTGTAVTSDTYANSYSSLVGKYLPNITISSSGSSTAGKKSRTTNLYYIVYVISATQDSFTYKIIFSNKNMTEDILASEEDDYGTSYYFRGAVKNNYVQFANKCWRIVRIAGDGSVKIVLNNDNTSKASNPCSSSNNSDDAAFAHYSGTTYTTKFNPNNDDNAYVGFMYGTAGASDYASAHANVNKSIILTSLETWYKKNLTSYEDKIADTIWCNDKTTVTDTTFNPTSVSDVNGLGYAKNRTYYATTQRLIDTNGTGPSLKCNGELSKITTKIGLLTADEVAFAGSVRSLYNYSTFLCENTGTEDWWTMSPYSYDYGAGVWSVREGSLVNWGAAYSMSLRPSISLVSNIEISGGTGTSEDPYIVK